MLDPKNSKQIADRLLGMCEDFAAEAIVNEEHSALTRYGENVITQNVSGRQINVRLRIIKDQKTGTASTGNLSDEGLKACFDAAKIAWKVSSVDKNLLPLPTQQSYPIRSGYYQDTFDLSPEVRAECVSRAVKECSDHGLSGAGVFSNNSESVAIANTNGLWGFYPFTSASFSLSAMAKDASGWAEEPDASASRLDVDRIIKKAVNVCLKARNPISVEPGEWTVVFEPAAVADFLLFLGWEALNGLAYAEERSAFSGKIGEKVFGSNITITDDASHPLSIGLPFDYEGMPRHRVTMVEKGVFKSPVHDRITAAQAGTISTGHSLPQPNPHGPTPLNMIMDGGASSLEEMIASTKRGLLVTRLHYTNILDPMKLLLTGMTRDGFFLIEDGKVTNGLKNMRFTDSLLRIFNNVADLSSDIYKTNTFWGGGGTIAPAIKVEGFRFTSKTEN